MHRNAPLTFKHPAGDLPESAQPNREPSGLGALALVLVVLATIIGLSTWSDVRRESLRKQLEHARGREVHLAGQIQSLRLDLHQVRTENHQLRREIDTLRGRQ